MEYIIIVSRPSSSSRDTWRTVRPLKPIRRQHENRGMYWHVRDQKTDETFTVLLTFKGHGAHAGVMNEVTWFQAPPCWIERTFDDENDESSFLTPTAKKRGGDVLSLTANGKRKRRRILNEVKKNALDHAARVSFVVNFEELPQTLRWLTERLLPDVAWPFIAHAFDFVLNDKDAEASSSQPLLKPPQPLLSLSSASPHGLPPPPTSPPSHLLRHRSATAAPRSA